MLVPIFYTDFTSSKTSWAIILPSPTYYIKIGVSLCRIYEKSWIPNKKKCFCRKLWSQLHPHSIAAFIVLTIRTLQSVVVMAEPVKFSTIKPWFGPGKSFWALLCGPVRLTLLAILDGPVVVVVSMCTQTSSETLLKEGATGSWTPPSSSPISTTTTFDCFLPSTTTLCSCTLGSPLGHVINFSRQNGRL